MSREFFIGLRNGLAVSAAMWALVIGLFWLLR